MGAAADVTVIVPTFNRQEFIGSALESIANQTVRPGQVIVVNDGSTDGTAGVLDQFGGSIEVITKPNGGKSSALNLGLTHARGEHVWIFDDDDIAAPDALRLMRDALDGDPGAGFSFGAYSTFRTGQEDRLHQHPPQLENVMEGGAYLDALGLFVGLMVRNFIMQPGMLVRRRCYDEAGPFDERLIRSQDYDMLLRLARRCRGLPVPDVVFHQRQHPGRRGSLAAPIAAESVARSWTDYDLGIFRALHASHALSEFLPGSAGGSLTDDEAVTARLVRGCIMGRRQLWSLAAEDFGAAANLCASIGRTSLNPVECFALRHTLDVSNFAPESVLGSAAFRAALASFPGWRLREEVRSALLFPLPYVVRSYVTDKTKADAVAILRAYRSIATPYSAIHSLAAKAREKLFG